MVRDSCQVHNAVLGFSAVCWKYRVCVDVAAMLQRVVLNANACRCTSVRVRLGTENC